MWDVFVVENADDLAAIVKIGEQSLPYYYNNIMLRYMLNDKKYIILKIINDHYILGGFLVAKKINKAQRLHINSLAINPKYRHLGLGTKLINKLKEYSCMDITLNVMETNNIAINFYEKNGFKRIKRLENYYHDKGTSAYTYLFDNIKS